MLLSFLLGCSIMQSMDTMKSKFEKWLQKRGLAEKTKSGKLGTIATYIDAINGICEEYFPKDFKKYNPDKSWQLLSEEVVSVAAKKLPSVTHISILGYSQGGVVASMLSGELGAKNIKSVVLMAPAAPIKDDVSRGIFLGATI